MKRLLPTLIALVALGVASVPWAANAQSIPECDFSAYPQWFSCALPTATPVPTQTPLATEKPLPTSTPISPTSTAVVPQPSITPTPIPAVAYIDGIPVCPDDDVTWHSTVERNSNGSIRCTYGHEHGDNPHALDGTLGPMGGWWNNGIEHDISYPWETLNENEVKHTAYKIIVRGSDANPLAPWYGDGAQNYIKAFRGTYHVDGPKGLVMSKYHSFGFEAVICSPDGNCGTVRFGGVQDLGERHIDEDGQFVCIYPDQDPGPPVVKYILDNMGVCGTESPKTLDQVRTTAGMGGGRRDETWYGDNLAHHHNGFAAGIDLAFGIIAGHVWSPIHPWNPLDAASPDPNVRGDYAPHYARQPLIPQNIDDWHHGTSVEVSALGLRVSIPPDASGRINAAGFTDRYGNVDTTCTAAGANCVPFSVVNVPVGTEGYRDQEAGHGDLIVNYDVINPATGHSLIVWPN